MSSNWDSPVHAVRLFLHGRTLRTAAPTALVVGTILCVVNQGATLAAGEATTGTWVRMIINYLVPFVVASVGYLGARRITREAGRSEPQDGSP